MRNCDRCGKIYASPNPKLCSDCVKQDQDDFNVVREFLKENPKVSIEVISEATGVDELKIREYLRQGQLELADVNGPALECTRCGKPISKGDYCVLCQREIQNSLRSGGSQPKAVSKDKASGRESFFLKYRDK